MFCEASAVSRKGRFGGDDFPNLPQQIWKIVAPKPRSRNINKLLLQCIYRADSLKIDFECIIFLILSFDNLDELSYFWNE